MKTLWLAATDGNVVEIIARSKNGLPAIQDGREKVNLRLSFECPLTCLMSPSNSRLVEAPNPIGINPLSRMLALEEMSTLSPARPTPSPNLNMDIKRRVFLASQANGHFRRPASRKFNQTLSDQETS